MNQTEAAIAKTMQFLRYGDPLERNQQWLLEQIDSLELQDLASRLSILSIQVLIEIAKDSQQNAANIAQHLNVTRGGVSRVAKRLIHDKLIEETRKKDNQKEVYYRLTKTGLAIYQVHLQLIEQINDKHLHIIRSFEEKEQAIILDYLEQVSQLSVE